MQRARVVLPQPLEPAISNISPGLSSNEIFSIARSGRVRYWKERFSMTRGESGITSPKNNNDLYCHRDLIANLYAESCRGVTVDNRDSQNAGAPKQGDQFSYRPFTESVDHAFDHYSIQMHHNVLFLPHRFPEVFRPYVGGNIAKMVNVNHLTAPAVFCLFRFGQFKSERIGKGYPQFTQGNAIRYMRGDGCKDVSSMKDKADVWQPVLDSIQFNKLGLPARLLRTLEQACDRSIIGTHKKPVADFRGHRAS